MAIGFGRKYWLQLVRIEGSPLEDDIEANWLPWLEWETAPVAIALLLKKYPDIEYGLVLDGRVKKGETCVPVKRILAEVNREGARNGRKICV